MLSKGPKTSPATSVHFLFAKKYQYSGSTVMRGQQLSQIAQQTLPGNYHITYTQPSIFFRNSYLFLTKGVVKTSSLRFLSRMKKRGNVLIFDPIDEPVPPDKVRFADIIVAASRTARNKYTEIFPASRIELVDHHVDPRISTLDFSNQPAVFQAGYFGELINTVITPRIKRQVDFIHTDTSKQDESWFKQLPNYNFHYAIRKVQKEYPDKPFLKGFSAARCNANILIQAEPEALSWLGEDYPYILHGPVNQTTILQALDKARASYGSAEWRKGLEIMQDIKRQTSNQAIGKQLRRLFN